jgi:hypothetical protein
LTGTTSGSDNPQHSPSTALTVKKAADLIHGTTQTDNTVGGHLAGGDVTVISPGGDLHIIQQISPPSTKSVFRKLFEKLEKEAATDKTLSAYISQLEVYTRIVADEEVIGLEEKLRAAGRERQAPMAIALKEHVYADIKANIFSHAYQLIVATLMSKIHERFETDIRHLIESGADRKQIDKAVSELITNPIANELDDCPQFHDVSLDYVRGMTFFLTGNCHIRWD